MATLAELLISLGVDSRNLETGLGSAERGVAGFAQRVTGGLQTVGKAALIAGGALAVGVGAGVVKLASEAIPAASNLNEAMNATRVVFGDAAGRVQAFGQQAADAAGLSAAEFNQMAAQSGAMLQNYGLSADEAAGTTIDLATRAADMASIFNTDVSEAMTAVNAALRGEVDPIERFGVSMNAAAVEARALEMGYEKVNGQFDTAALTQARLALLFEQTDNIAGDFANTSGDLANASRVNAARWENFMAKVGTLGTPIMETMQGVLMDIGDKVFPLVEEAIARALPVVEDIAGAISTFVENVLGGKAPLETLGQLLEDLGLPPGVMDAFNRLSDWFAEHGPALKETADETFGRLAETVGKLVDSVGQFVGEQGAKLAAWFEENGPLIEDFAAAVGQAAATIGEVLAGAWPIISNVLGGVIELALGIAKTIMQVATGDWAGAWETIKQTAANVWEALKGAFNEFADWVTGWFGTSWAEVKATWQENWDVFTTIVSTVWENIKTSVVEFVTGIVDDIRGFVGDFTSVGSDLFEGLREGILGKVSDIIDAVTGGVRDAIEAAKRLLGIASPSRVFAEVGENMMWGMALGIERQARMPELALTGANEALRELAGVRLPQLSAALPAGLGGAGGMGGGVVVNLSVNAPAGLMDPAVAERLAWELAPAIRRELEARGRWSA